jgi:hypothetical protein
MEESVREQLNAFLQAPSAEAFLRLREAVMGSRGYAPYARDLHQANALLKEGKFEEARDHLLSVMANYLLNPSVHQMLAYAHHELGDEQAARFEYAVAGAMMQGILSTGDGTAERPYLVLHTADEYDVLRHLGKRPQKQSLVQAGEKRLDRQECDDGSEVCFDVTVQLTHLQRQFPRRE